MDDNPRSRAGAALFASVSKLDCPVLTFVLVNVKSNKSSAIILLFQSLPALNILQYLT